MIFGSFVSMGNEQKLAISTKSTSYCIQMMNDILLAEYIKFQLYCVQSIKY